MSDSVRCWPVAALCAVALLGCKGREPGQGAGEGAGSLGAVARLPAKLSVDFVYVQRDGESGPSAILKGGISKALISLEKNPAREVDVTISEECPGCAGSAWSSSIWMGAFLATSLKGNYLADYKFSVRARGFIDGPSAGALLSASMLAMLTGAPILPKVAMTGALNPDMSIGPVGGIPQKLLAAVQAGVTQFCYPAPQASVWDANFRAAVDVQELARRHGVSARPVRDLRDAYQCLTGQTLPQEDRVVEADAMKDSFAQMRVITDAWLARSRTAFEELKAMPGRERFTPWVLKVRQSHDAAERDLKAQRIPTAYHQAMQAAAGFEVLLLAARAVDARKGGDVTKLLSSLEPLLLVEGELKALEQQMAASKLDTVGTVLNLVWAHASAAQSYGFLDAARKAEDAERKIRLLFQAKMTLEHAKDVWSAWKDEKVQTALRLDAKDVGVLAHSYLSAATASLQYHRALTQDRGGRGGPDAARRARGEDMDAVVLRQLGYAAQHLQDESLRGALAALGASLQSYVDASYLMASGYLRDFYEVNDQLKEKAQKQGQRPVTTAPEGSAPFSTYMDLLEYADRKARESATRAQRVLGAIPSAARFHYLAGRDQLIHAEEQQKQRSLYEFWYASALADLAVQLAVGPAGLRPVAAR